jgi:hypothetical protein
MLRMIYLVDVASLVERAKHPSCRSICSFGSDRVSIHAYEVENMSSLATQSLLGDVRT